MNSVDSLVASYVDSTTFLNSPTGGSSNQQNQQIQQPTVLSSHGSMHTQPVLTGSTTVPLGSLSPDELTGSSQHHHNVNPLSINVNMSGMGMVNPIVISNNRRTIGSLSDDLTSELLMSLCLCRISAYLHKVMLCVVFVKGYFKTL